MIERKYNVTMDLPTEITSIYKEKYFLITILWALSNAKSAAVFKLSMGEVGIFARSLNPETT
ncbi:hypothetical protein [Thorsellia kenyensis]|uniref:Uncharacterized protein n=1 Tax=Thorsellia kenyensis TaxID=1549888 RepID=A0ABV6CE78_9GAMM